MKHHLHQASDEKLAEALQEYERQEIEARNSAAECRLHIMMRQHVHQQSLRDQIKALEAQLSEAAQ